MKIPNILTLSRIFLAILFIYFLSQVGIIAKVIALAIFIIASITDFLDGYIAKKYGLETDFGKIMDPIADKFLMLSAFFLFYKMNIIPLWMFSIIFLREIIITSLRLFSMKKGRVLAAEKAGKYKTVFQIVAVYFILIFIVLINLDIILSWSHYFIFGLYYFIYVLMVIVVLLTVYSGVSFLKNNYFDARKG